MVRQEKIGLHLRCEYVLPGCTLAVEWGASTDYRCILTAWTSERRRQRRDPCQKATENINVLQHAVFGTLAEVRTRCRMLGNQESSRCRRRALISRAEGMMNARE